MTFQSLQQQWKKSFEETLSSIERCVTHVPEDQIDMTHFRTLCQWLLETTHNPYDFLPQGFQGYSYNPYDTDSLFNLIHHALIDDGEISFVKMMQNNEVLRVFIMFRWHNEDNFNQMCFEENKHYIQTQIDSAIRFNNFCTNLKAKYPDKTLSVKPVPKVSDFTFVAHYHALEFIKEVEELETKKQLQREKFEALRQKNL